VIGKSSYNSYFVIKMTTGSPQVGPIKGGNGNFQCHLVSRYIRPERKSHCKEREGKEDKEREEEEK
jgi:hypothetical protein